MELNHGWDCEIEVPVLKMSCSLSSLGFMASVVYLGRVPPENTIVSCGYNPLRMTLKYKSRLPCVLLVLAILALDRWIKWLIQTRLVLNQTILIIDGFFNITYVRNTGVAFGILDSVNLPFKSTVLAVLTLVAIAGVLVYSWRTPANQTLLQTALSLILAGALGNLYDRVMYRYVIDFIEVYYRTYRWPSFNVADSAITVGVGLLVLQIFRKDTP
jgi:signal peptidase II